MKFDKVSWEANKDTQGEGLYLYKYDRKKKLADGTGFAYLDDDSIVYQEAEEDYYWDSCEGCSETFETHEEAIKEFSKLIGEEV